MDSLVVFFANRIPLASSKAPTASSCLASFPNVFNPNSLSSLQEEVDAGAIITQEAVPVLNGDTVETLQERVKCAEHKAYPRAMELLASGRIKLNEDNKVQWMW